MEIVHSTSEFTISVGDNAFVKFAGVGEDEISNNYRADAEVAVQEWLDTAPTGYENCKAGISCVCEDGISVKLVWS